MIGGADILALEIFACCGGMAEGFRRAEIAFRWVVDWSADAVESYAANLGHRPVQMDVRDLVRLARDGWRPAQDLDLIVADPPCTPWSTAGKRQGLDDERDMLRDTCELIRLLRPKAYLIGNIPGLEMAPNAGAVQATIGELARAGYCVRDEVVLDAADYGVPQHRVRPFWFGHLSGPCIRWPAPTHRNPACAVLPFDDRKPWVTCRDALGHLSPEQLGRQVFGRKGKAPNPGTFNLPSEGDAPARAVSTRMNDCVRIDDPKHPPSPMDGPAYAVTARDRAQSGSILDWRHADRPATTIYAGTDQLAAPGKGSPMSRGRIDADALITRRLTDADYRARFGTDRPQSEREIDTAAPAPAVQALECRNARWPRDRPSTVVCADERLEHPGHHEPSNKAIAGYVRISELAALILQGFPETWRISGKTKKARWSQIGQAIPPPLGHAVARSVRAQIEATRAQAELQPGSARRVAP